MKAIKEKKTKTNLWEAKKIKIKNYVQNGKEYETRQKLN